MRRLRLLGVMAAVFLAGCNGRNRTPDDAIVVAVEANPRSLDPRFAADSLGSKISELTCPGLLARDAEGRLVPELAESWAWESPTRVRFRLREGLLFHDGSPLGAEDVRATYRSILDPSTASIYAGAYAEIARIETDGRDVVFHLHVPSLPLLQDLVSPGVMKKEGLGPAPVTLPVCAGPFRAVAFRRDDAVELAANPHYWRGAPPIRRLVFRILPDATIRVLEVAHGSVDLLQNDVPPHFLPVLRKKPEVRLESRPGRNLKYLVFNVKHPALGDARVRRALAHAIDRDALVRFKLEGLGRKAHGLLAADDPFAPAQAPEDRIEHDPARARALLEEAGLSPGPDGVRLRLEYKTSLSESAIAIAKVIRSDLAKVGVEVRVRPAEFGTFFQDVQRGNFEIYTLTSAAIVDPDFFRWMLASENIPPRGGSSNRSGWSNAALDALLERGAAEADPEKRRAIYAEAQAIATRDLPVFPLWHESVFAARSRRLEGYVLSPFASYAGLAQASKKSRDPEAP